MSQPESFIEQCRDYLNPDQMVLDGQEFDLLALDALPESNIPQGILYPESADQISHLLKLAGDSEVKIWPYSTALNWGYGNTLPDTGIGFLMVLSRMNQIHKVDEKLGYAVIEPGVTYRQLNAYLVDNDIPLWMDCTGGPPEGSVLGNALERGFGATPYFDHYGCLAGLTVVLPNGSVLETGNYTSNDNDGSQYTYPQTAGPLVNGLFSQSNLGIVIRAGISLMPKPESLEVGTLKIYQRDTLIESINTFQQLLINGEVPGTGRFSNDISAFSVLTQAKDEGIENLACLSENDRSRLQEKYGVAPWNLTYGLYGSQRKVAAAKKQTQSTLKLFGKVRFINPKQAESLSEKTTRWLAEPDSRVTRGMAWLSKRLLNTSLESLQLTGRLLKAYQGIPSENIVKRAYFHSKNDPPEQDVHIPRDRIGIMWFVPLIPFLAEEIVEYIDHCEAEYSRQELTPLLTVSPMNDRTVILLSAIVFDRADEASSKRAKALYRSLQKDALNRGYQQYRCGFEGWKHLDKMNPELWDFYKKLKESLDPNQIIAPGRYGI